MTPTMKDVAARAGVSIKSVSRVVNEHPNISPGVRNRVLHAIAELGWQPNTHARSLRTGRTGVIALSLVDLRTPTSARLAEALVIEAERAGLEVSIEPSRGRDDRVRQTLDSRGALFDAVVHVGPLPAGVPSPGHDPELPVLTICTSSEPAHGAPPALDTVDVDDAAAASAIERHLRAVGQGDVVILAHASGTPDAFVDHLIRAFPEAAVLRPEPDEGGAPGRRADRAAGRTLTARALAAVPTLGTLACADDELAIGALSLLRERGIAVPERVTLTGHGNIEDGWFTTPSLTTIDPAVAEIARRTIDLIRRRLAGDRTAARRIVVPVTLVRAESTLGSSGRAAGSASAPSGGRAAHGAASQEVP
ncbi:LacI family DNA-binding transcriptional regulator [Brachybacterium sp. UNK5269]|uniref:LacI family DNA-binding transcriptional regulator n=1 Tax=Brachybacterium sp. UNK5269 TaxID=3408576 RepID=UPI003BB1E64A